MAIGSGFMEIGSGFVETGSGFWEIGSGFHKTGSGFHKILFNPLKRQKEGFGKGVERIWTPYI